MNNKFDELAKGLAQSVTRRQALKRFGLGLAGMALACFGLANNAKAAHTNCLPSGTSCHLGGRHVGEPSCTRCCSNHYGCIFESCQCN
jgi:hypothetical protein